jgi:hypothetical protein
MNIRAATGSLLVLALIPRFSEAANPAMLVIERIEVRTVNQKGKAWDGGGGAPDLKISVERISAPKGEKHITAVQENRFKAVFNCKALEVQSGEEIEIRVMDEDVSSDDEVGTIKQKITAEMLKTRELEISFDQVDKLILKFIP